MKHPTVYKRAVAKELDQLLPNGAAIVDKYEPIMDKVDLHYNAKDYAQKLLEVHQRNITTEEWLEHLEVVNEALNETVYRKRPIRVRLMRIKPYSKLTQKVIKKHSLIK